MKNEDTHDRELVTTRVLKAAPNVVFEVWTDPAHISNWWGRVGFTTTTNAMDLRPEGEWRFTMHGPDGRNYENRIEFIEVSKPSRIVYRHRDEGEVEPVRSLVTVTFAPLGRRTLLTMRMVFESNEDLARIEETYGACGGLLMTTTRFADEVERQRIKPRSDRELVTSRIYPATPERIFAAFRNPEKLATWWGPNGFTNTFHQFDFRAGGDWKYTMHGPTEKNFENESVFVAIEEPQRIAIHHRSPPIYDAEFQLVPVAHGTKVVFYQQFESAKVCESISRVVVDANEQNLDRLGELLSADY